MMDENPELLDFLPREPKVEADCERSYMHPRDNFDASSEHKKDPSSIIEEMKRKRNEADRRRRAELKRNDPVAYAKLKERRNLRERIARKKESKLRRNLGEEVKSDPLFIKARRQKKNEYERGAALQNDPVRHKKYLEKTRERRRQSEFQLEVKGSENVEIFPIILNEQVAEETEVVHTEKLYPQDILGSVQDFLHSTMQDSDRADYQALVALSQFQNIMRQEFRNRDLSDGMKVSVEKLNLSCLRNSVLSLSSPPRSVSGEGNSVITTDDPVLEVGGTEYSDGDDDVMATAILELIKLTTGV